MRVLLTGMSGTGKSALVHELRERGYAAHDADDGFAEPRADGRWGWRADLGADLLAREPDRLLFFAGCSEEQAELPFDYRVLLTAPRSLLVKRLRTRATNAYGRDDHELAEVLADLVEVEPRLRRSADLILTTAAPTAAVADELLRRIAELRPGLVYCAGRSVSAALVNRRLSLCRGAIVMKGTAARLSRRARLAEEPDGLVRAGAP